MASNTYAAIGNKEDVSDIITNISPSDTPLYSCIMTLLNRHGQTEENPVFF